MQPLLMKSSLGWGNWKEKKNLIWAFMSGFNFLNDIRSGFFACLRSARAGPFKKILFLLFLIVFCGVS